MYRTIALSCCLIVSGCSTLMTNKGSLLKLDGCHVWPPSVDTTLAFGIGAATLAVHQGNYINGEDKRAYITGSLLVAGAFAMSALMGYGDYWKCEKEMQSRE